MAAISYGKVFVSIPQLTSERDWLVNALKASGQWEFVTGVANRKLKDTRARSRRLSTQ